MLTLVLPLGPERYAVPLACVHEVLEFPRVTPLPTAPDTVLGLLNVRGLILPLLDTVALLGIGRLDAPAYAVIAGATPCALAVDRLPSTCALGEFVGGTDRPGSGGVFATDDGLVVLLDVDVLLGRVRDAA